MGHSPPGDWRKEPTTDKPKRARPWLRPLIGGLIVFAAARQDWGRLDLSIDFEDLRRRGPGLLLDHRLDNGARIMLWTAARDG